MVVPFEIAQKVFQKGVRCQDIEFADPCTAALLGPYGVQGHGTAGAGCRAEEVPSLMSEHINGGVLVMESCDQAFEYNSHMSILDATLIVEIVSCFFSKLTSRRVSPLNQTLSLGQPHR